VCGTQNVDLIDSALVPSDLDVGAAAVTMGTGGRKKKKKEKNDSNGSKLGHDKVEQRILLTMLIYLLPS
jgi:hypothetical protein